MARTVSSFCCLLFFFIVIFLCNGSSSVHSTRVMDQRKLLQAPKWCVARQGLSDDDLQTSIDKLCGPLKVQCSNISPGFACFEPNTKYDHASWALSYYASLPNGICFTDDVAQIVETDPSHDGCFYPPCVVC